MRLLKIIDEIDRLILEKAGTQTIRKALTRLREEAIALESTKRGARFDAELDRIAKCLSEARNDIAAWQARARATVEDRDGDGNLPM